MLGNEKYAGDVLMQKTYVEDFLTHRKVKNNGKLPQYYVEDDHEPIVPKSIFFLVQGELMRRAAYKDEPNQIRFGPKDALRNRLICGICGRTLKLYTYPDPKDNEWRCRKRAYVRKKIMREMKPDCDCRNVKDSDVKRAIVEAFNRLPAYRDELIRRQAELQMGEIKRIDALTEKSKQSEIALEERRLKLESEGRNETDDEIIFLESQITKEQEHRNALILERSEHARIEMQIRLLLELVEMMKETFNAYIRNVYKVGEALPSDLSMTALREWGEEAATSAACYDPDDFFRRTSHRLPTGLLDTTGTITRFENDMVIQYLKSVTIFDDHYQVNFKAGLSISVE